jgi:hypothetical protein
MRHSRHDLGGIYDKYPNRLQITSNGFKAIEMVQSVLIPIPHNTIQYLAQVAMI